MSRFLSGVVAAMLTAVVMPSFAAAPRQPAVQTKQAPVLSPLKLDGTALGDVGLKKFGVGYYPVSLKLTPDKPAGILQEPIYKGKPLYATFHLGNGPRSLYVLSLDVVDDGDYKIYIDKNRNGNLADDGDGVWKAQRKTQRGTMFGLDSYVLRASWGTNGKETASGDYGLGFYCFAGKEPRLLMRREGARVGTITLGGKSHQAMLVENDGDALYNKSIQTDDKGKPVGDVKSRPVWLLMDTKDNGKLEMVDVRAPFTLNGATYEASIANDGSSVKLMPTTKVAADLTPKTPVLLAAGVPAPNFSAQGQDGKTLQLADYKGQVVILDFWATWCGPCQKSMPHLEKVWQAVKTQDVAVVGICVWDTRSEYDKWVPANNTKYTFTLAFDPAEQKTAESIASKLYNVSGIPTTYIIDKNGKVADAIVGYDDGDVRVEKALKKLGIDVAVDAASATTK